MKYYDKTRKLRKIIFTGKLLLKWNKRTEEVYYELLEFYKNGGTLEKIKEMNKRLIEKAKQDRERNAEITKILDKYIKKIEE